MDVDAARAHAGLKPLPPLADTEAETDEDEVITEDATIGNEDLLRGIPAVGRVSGTIKGTRPGPGASGEALEREARELNMSGRRIVNRHLYKRPKDDRPSRT